jgi:hypothetical protein
MKYATEPLGGGGGGGGAGDALTVTSLDSTDCDPDGRTESVTV